ncbi:hypothetical protein GCM10029976_093310 [Kribbella albertanoniae]|uniref:Uncharacterized protein n=1 Tax=Kribbella albertanoniae TaxID=1266829 RepID=A0A4V2XR93_9ACTN|nr:hypothetical protein [Kribbella albertanoniae]TDC29045.1 hypothetical protein E1261_16745 [Kribbella albertanoniae]
MQQQRHCKPSNHPGQHREFAVRRAIDPAHQYDAESYATAVENPRERSPGVSPGTDGEEVRRP